MGKGTLTACLNNNCLHANVHFLWPNSLKIKGFLSIAGRDLVPPDVEQVGTVESLQAGVCDGDNLLWEHCLFVFKKPLR